MKVERGPFRENTRILREVMRMSWERGGTRGEMEKLEMWFGNS